MKNKVIICIISLICITVSWADSLEVLFVDGIVEKKDSKLWEELLIGDLVPASATLRLAEESIVELMYGDVNISLYSEGVYPVKDLIRDQEELSGWKLGSVMQDKMQAIFDNDHMESLSVAVLGVRADFKAGSAADEVEWMIEEESPDPLAEGVLLINQREYSEALELLESAADRIQSSDRQEYYFYLALANIGLGKNGKALSLLARVRNDRNKAYFSELIIIKGKLFLEGLAYKEALQLFDLYIDTLPGGKYLQSVYYMSAICLNNLGFPEEAVKRLQLSIKINPGSQIAVAAEGWIPKLTR